mmetsp:Transcript_85128/g.214646  ORF Transcript_85128/g.214646 Transcript_85128/m.214646 type:complete len:620 (-) Transcript_85128:123-1982(-)
MRPPEPCAPGGYCSHSWDRCSSLNQTSIQATCRLEAGVARALQPLPQSGAEGSLMAGPLRVLRQVLHVPRVRRQIIVLDEIHPLEIHMLVQHISILELGVELVLPRSEAPERDEVVGPVLRGVAISHPLNADAPATLVGREVHAIRVRLRVVPAEAGVPRHALHVRAHKVVLDEDLLPPGGRIVLGCHVSQHLHQVLLRRRRRATAPRALQPAARGEEERDDRAAIHRGRLREAGQAEEGGGDVHLRPRGRKGRAGSDSGAPGQEVYLCVPLVDMPLVHGDVELPQLEAVVAGVQEVGAVGQAELLDGRNDFADDVVHGHERPPPVLEDAVDHVGCLWGKQGLRAHIPVVMCPARGRDVPIGRSGRLLRPRSIPMVPVPRCGIEGLVRRLRGDVGHEGLPLLGHLPDPSDRRVSDDRGGVVPRVTRKMDLAIREAVDILGLEARGDVVAAGIREPRVETGWRLLWHHIDVLAEEPCGVAALLLQHPHEAVVVDLLVVHMHVVGPDLLDVVEVAPREQFRPRRAANRRVDVPIRRMQPLILHQSLRPRHRRRPPGRRGREGAAQELVLVIGEEPHDVGLLWDFPPRREPERAEQLRGRRDEQVLALGALAHCTKQERQQH